MRKRIVFIFLTGLLIIHPVLSQDWTIVMREPSVMITDLCFLDDGLHGFAVGSGSASGGALTGLFQTQDGGNVWSPMNFPFMESVSMNSVFFVTPAEGWVAGNNGLIYHTTDGGAIWTSQASGISRKLTSIHFINNLEGWITGGWQDGNQYLLLKTINGGATWQNLSFGTDAYACNSVFFTDAVHGWIAAFNNQLIPRIFSSSDGGASWVSQPIPLSNTGTQMTSVKFANPTTGWATVSSLYENPSGPVLFTNDGGANWSIQYYTNQHYNYLDVRDENHVAVVGLSILYPSVEKLCVTENGGTTWTSKNVPMLEYTQGIHYGDSNIWLGAGKSIILSTPDMGTSWSWEHYSPLLKSMEWISDEVGWAVAGSNVGTDHWTFKTTDGGLTWETDSVAPGGAAVTFPDPDHGWMLWEGNQARIWRTIDGGVSWNQYSIPSSGNWIGGICFPSPDTGWAYGSNGTLKFTANGGMTWSNQNAGSSDYIEKVFFVNSLEGWAGGGYGGGNGFISHTTNAGLTWELQNYPSGDHVNDICFLDYLNGWVCSTGGNVFFTTDGGETWIQGGYVPEMATKILMVDDLHGWMLGYGGGSSQQGFIYSTTDGGYGWEEEWSGDWPQANLSDLSLQPGNYLWSCGSHSALLLHDQQVAIPGSSRNRNHPALSVNPNPVNQFSEICYSLSRPQRVDLILLDITGREVTSLVSDYQPAGFHSISWDAVNQKVHPGLYLIVLKTHEGTGSVKVVVQ